MPRARDTKKAPQLLEIAKEKDRTRGRGCDAVPRGVRNRVRFWEVSFRLARHFRG
jgi:hypothetical protein